MTRAKLIKEDEGGMTILINEKDYLEYLDILQKWIDENPNAKIEDSKNKIKEIITTKEEICSKYTTD